jgi:hypothetical protein
MFNVVFHPRVYSGIMLFCLAPEFIRGLCCCGFNPGLYLSQFIGGFFCARILTAEGGLFGDYVILFSPAF